MSYKRLTPEAKAASLLDAKRKERITKVKQKNPNPIVVGKGVKRATEVTIIPPGELDTLRIDEQYQRPENRELVNQLLAVLEAGGIVPDPVTVAVRPDKTRWIVDGQQRWAAHYLAMKPLAAVLYHVDTVDEERKLFSVLNTYRRPSPAIRMRAWTGPSSELIRFIAGSPASPLMGQLNFAGSGGRTSHAAPTVLRAVGAALGLPPRTGAGNATEDFMRSLDRVYVADRKRAIRVVQAFLTLAKQVFTLTRWQSTPMFALGSAAAIRWEGAAALAQPSKAALYNLRRLNWTNPPIQERQRWMPLLVQDVLRRWPK